MSIDINGISGNYNSYNTESLKPKAAEEEKASENTKAAENAKASEGNAEEKPAVTYEKGMNTGSGLYSINKMSQQDRSAIVNQLKADAEARQKQLLDIVHKTLTGQVTAFGKASNDDNSIWKTLASGNFTVDEETKKQAQEDISEDGYWGVKQTSQRLFDFASALAGDDVDKMKEMQSAMEKGFKQATKDWGQDLPSISKDTLEAANKLFEDYYASKAE